MLTELALAKQLGCDVSKIKAWTAQGMPYVVDGRCRKYHEDAVCDWLVQSGIAREDAGQGGDIVTSIDAVAGAFGVGARTVSSWIAQGMPHKSGTRHGQPGYYCISEIRDWRQQRSGTAQPAIQEEFLSAKLQTQRIKNQKLSGGLVDRQAVIARVSQLFKFARSVLEKVPRRVVSQLPDSVSAADRAVIRERLEREMQSVFVELQTSNVIEEETA